MLKTHKNYLRSKLSQKNLNSFAVLEIECDIPGIIVVQYFFSIPVLSLFFKNCTDGTFLCKYWYGTFKVPSAQHCCFFSV